MTYDLKDAMLASLKGKRRRKVWDPASEISALRERLAEAVKYVAEGQEAICSEFCGTRGHSAPCLRFAAFLAKENGTPDTQGGR